MAIFNLFSPEFGTAGQNLSTRIGSLVFYLFDDTSETPTRAGFYTSRFPTYFAEITGTDFTYQTASGQPQSFLDGNVTDLTMGPDGGSVLIASDLRIDGAVLRGFMESDQSEALARYVLRRGDVITGTAADDILHGYRGSDKINGDQGDDQLFGGAGRDRLNGFTGADEMTGGSGADRFIFSTSPEFDTGVNLLTDFRSGRDKLMLDDAVFGGVPTGQLAPGAFTSSVAATSPGHRLIFDSAAGTLAWDSDGAGGNDAFVFARLAAGLTITAADVLIF
jgi:Ca2+-binding RTX toxin-like protein